MLKKSIKKGNSSNHLHQELNERGSFLGNKLVKSLKPVFKYQSSIDQLQYPLNLPLRISALLENFLDSDLKRVVVLGADHHDIFDDAKWFALINSLVDSQLEIAFVGDEESIYKSFKVSSFPFIANKLPYIEKNIVSIDEVCESDLLVVANTSPAQLQSLISDKEIKPAHAAFLGATYSEAALVSSFLTNEAQHDFFNAALKINKQSSSHHYFYHGHASFFTPEAPLSFIKRTENDQAIYEVIPYCMDAGFDSTSRILDVKEDDHRLILSNFISIDTLESVISCSMHEVKWRRSLKSGELENIKSDITNPLKHVGRIMSIVHESLVDLKAQ
ncbi:MULTISPECIES: hypothetical protein [Vibrio]|uniref:hypothetical protein n=1 Tax=Vibrio TaxID=662 RepID=UPI00078D9920|nr:MULTISPECIES: hypothetical protein [Vibrio]BAU70857.1 hypothetical protein [Vibrio sp. 04Ya108]BBM67574.1 hypothetical protein VA249_42200 [Vibrio alfacsensis]BCN27057.1 hypothetical protein VYA_42490 [Vibrio alfacsensis]